MKGYLCRSGTDASELRWNEVFPERAACRHAQWCDKVSGGSVPTRLVEVMIDEEWCAFTVTASEVIQYEARPAPSGGAT